MRPIERTQQLSRFVALRRGAVTTAKMRYLTNQRRGQAGVQQLQPGLKNCEKADQAIGLGAQMPEIERQDKNADEHGVRLACVAKAGVAKHR